MNKREYSVCFSGHRPEKLEISENEVKKLLEQAIINSIKEGYTVFITGMARGVDIWAAEIVLKEKKIYKNIELICAVPVEGFENNRSEKERWIYNKIISEANTVLYISSHYNKYCFQLRNKYMVDNSSKLIAVYNGSCGGTRNTINYAKKKGIKIESILK